MLVLHLGAGYVAVFNQGKFATLVTYDLWAFLIDIFPYMYMCIQIYLHIKITSYKSIFVGMYSIIQKAISNRYGYLKTM